VSCNVKCSTANLIQIYSGEKMDELMENEVWGWGWIENGNGMNDKI